MTCKRFFFKGRVQGVCFRDKVQRVARELGVTGWVCNQSDGRVECLVEGDADGFLERVKALPFPVRIDNVEAGDCAPQGFKCFEVRAGR